MSENKLAKNKPVGKIVSVILVIFALIYNVSPVDFIVDVTPLIGLAVDVILSLAAIVNLYMKWRKK